ncbi:phage tail protein [Ancylobacter amanitiformis]|uniref:Phage protein U n=1 Tax=Ancylobacter amanitiformis TaxID=217069 RepID=A0ABU0LQ96_9HYPH|nr:phage tail protein [Ancylobacter amanitiformis]MDQ0510872.1 phage protein U [Ancylobacter amanitiformis]
MPVPMALGPFMFESLSFGFNGLKRDLDVQWASNQVLGSLDLLQWMGGSGDAVTIEGVIFPEEFGGLGTMEGLRAMSIGGAVLPLVSLAGNVYGLHVVTSVGEDQSYHDRYGMPRMNVFRIGLRRFAGGSFSPVSIAGALFGG